MNTPNAIHYFCPICLIYDTGLSAEEGLWTRSGWGGKS